MTIQAQVSVQANIFRPLDYEIFEYRELRHLVQLRDTQVQQLTATKCRIKALLLYEGTAFPNKGDHWSARVLDELSERLAT